MAETQTLNFGPEWLRALSGGGSVTSPPLSPALPKYKLADYRYGREEMLALYVKDNKIPSDLQDKEFLPILQEEPLPPLALVPFTEEEQRNFSMSVNSAAVLRLTGRGGGGGGGTVAGAPRGRSSSRGRGRGRGEGGFYQRSVDDVEGGFGRGAREMHRSQSWEERADRRFEKPGRKEPDAAPGHFQINHIRSNYDEGGTGAARKHDFARSGSENWRTTRDEQNGEEDDVGWRLASSRRDGDRWRPNSPDGPRTTGWREHPEQQRRRFPFDSRGDEERGYRRTRTGSGSLDDERDSLPEWCLDDADEEMGTFDSSGAFLSLKVRGAELPSRKKGPKEPIPEEAELDFHPSEECEEQAEEMNNPEETKDTERTPHKERDAVSVKSQVETDSSSPPSVPSQLKSQSSVPKSPSQPERVEAPPEKVATTPPTAPEPPEPLQKAHSSPSSLQHTPSTLPEISATPTVTQQQHTEMGSATTPTPLPFTENGSTGSRGGAVLQMDADDDEGLKHFEQEAEKMVAYLQDNAVDDDRLAVKMAERSPPTSLPLSHEAALKWFYKDPQGEIQGPFTNQEMVEWLHAGYFTMTLLVKRGCDEVFHPLGEMIKMWGRVPFTPGFTPPPLLAEVDQERLKRQQELTALNLYQLQQLQYQYLLRQQYAQALAQQKAAAALGTTAPPQQQLSLHLQQYQAVKRAADPPVTRSVSVPDSVWDLQNPASPPTGSSSLQHSTHTAWESGSVWDLPVDSLATTPSIEQIQQLEKAKAAKLEQERREAELQAKREEEKLKRQEEALLRQQQEEEERKRREEEEELVRRSKEEALRRQREQEAALCRQKEEEERLAQERREKEERRQREELLRKQEEERQHQEKLRRLEEEKQQQHQQRLAEEARQRQLQEEQQQKDLELQRQQEEQKRQQQELQKQQELQRQRQQQQEALRRLQQQQQQQQLAQMKLPSSSKWGQQSSTAPCQSQGALSLTEIQKLEEERERQAREEKRHQQELMKVLQQQQQRQQLQQQQAKLSGWGNVTKQPSATKSLLEIQQEEAQQMKQQLKKEQHSGGAQQNRAQVRMSSISNSVWGSVSNSTPQWGNSELGSSIWGSTDSKNSNMGFWDEPVKENPQPSKKNAKNNKSNANLSNSIIGKANKKVEEEEKKLLKLFQGVNNSQQDSFTQWCEQTLHTLNTANNLDVPTFTSFLKEVDSPYEVHDYVRAYLGDTPEARDFAKHFLERRAKQGANQQLLKQPQQKPQQQQQPSPQQQQDSVWGVPRSTPQPLIQSNHTSLQQSSFETVQSGKKKKKQKMVRADPSLLGFSVNAASERLNMGEIETVEDF